MFVFFVECVTEYFAFIMLVLMIIFSLSALVDMFIFFIISYDYILG